jgi:hypothetical protein
MLALSTISTDPGAFHPRWSVTVSRGWDISEISRISLLPTYPRNEAAGGAVQAFEARIRDDSRRVRRLRERKLPR